MMIPITFMVAGQACLRLIWAAVPREGDTVDLAVANPHHPRLHTVTGVTWRHLGGELKVDVHCEEKKDE